MIGSQIDLACDQPTSAGGQIRAGLVKAYAVTSQRRLDAFRDMPTAIEQGLPGFDLTSWHGMYAPTGTPEATRSKLTAALLAAVNDPAFKQKMAEMGGQVMPAADVTPANLKSRLERETARWAKVIRGAGLKPN